VAAAEALGLKSPHRGRHLSVKSGGAGRSPISANLRIPSGLPVNRPESESKERNVMRAELFVILAKPFIQRWNPMECLRVARALLLSTIPLTASAQTPPPIPIETTLPPFQFLQKPGPYPVGLRLVNQYDLSRKSPSWLGTIPNQRKATKAALCRRSSGIQRCPVAPSQRRLATM